MTDLTWDDNADWTNAQEAEDVAFENGSVSLDNAIPNSAIAQYDAQSLSGSDGDSITTWPDSAGAFDASGNATINDGGVNNYRTVEFDGLGDDFTVPSTEWSTLTLPVTVIFVGYTRESDTNYMFAMNTDYYYPSTRDDSDNYQIQTGVGHATSNSNTSSDVGIVTNIFGSNSARIRVNGNEHGSTDETSGVNFNALCIGNRIDDDTNYIDAIIGEFVVYDSDLEADGTLADEEQRLSDKWGISLA